MEHPSERNTFHYVAYLLFQPHFCPQRIMVDFPKAAHMNLALQTCENDPKLRLRKAARIYNVSLTIHSLRRASRTPRSDTTPNSRKLDQLEEEALVEYILKLDSQGYSPRLCNVGDMA